MSFYQKFTKIGLRFVSKATLLRYGFNYSPMYRRTTGRIIEVSEDITHIRIKIPISWKNRNYVNSIFGGSMLAATDPIYMVQLINILGDNFVVWDKAVKASFKRPAKQDLFADFNFTQAELDNIKSAVANEKEIEIIKPVRLTDKDRSKVFCEVEKTLYIANKDYFKQKRHSKLNKAENPG